MLSKIDRVNNNIIKMAYRNIIHEDSDVVGYIVRSHIRYISRIYPPTERKTRHGVLA